MNLGPARRLGFLFHLFVVFIILIYFILPGQVLAAPTPTPTLPPLANPNTAVWGDVDPIVTEVGKSADRARQLLWWVFQHPGIHTAPVLAQIWAIARNIVLVFVVMVIVAFGVSLILGRRRGAIGPVFSGITSPIFGVNIPIIFFRIAGILIYVMFSYIIIVALIQTSDIIMRFFIETVGGKDLFNIIFSGAGNTEANYQTFRGFRDVNPESLEMINTSLFYIRFTSFTYNAMSVILVLRTVFLWFMLILSPFLALLMPFVFIRNVGWIWIGVFFQWLFYGPLFALFLAALTRIWVSGIPYGFDFSRVNDDSGQVYRTAINILWGGPAQTLSPGNSANYVDTYAEYFIALIMLWAAIILPWLLLRIFRDYCCSMIAAGTNTLSSIFDRLRQYPVPPPPQPITPTTTSGMAVELPFRQKIEEKVKEVQRVRIEEITNISNVSTNEIARSMDLSVSRLADVSRMETNMMKKAEVASYLNKIRIPERLAQPEDREKFKQVREELVSRALKGDRVAQTLLAASDRQTRAMANQILTSVTAAPAKISAAVPQIKIEVEVPAVTNRAVVEQVASKSNISEIRIKDILSRITTEQISDVNRVKEVARSSGVSEEKVKEIVKEADQVWKSTFADYAQQVKQVAEVANVSEEKTRQVLSNITVADVSNEEKVKEVAKTSGFTEDKVKEIVRTVERVQQTKDILAKSDIIDQISQQNSISDTTTKRIILSISESELANTEKVSEVAKINKVTEEKVKDVVKASEKISQEQIAARERQEIEKISSRTSLSAEVVKQVLSNISESQISEVTKVKEVARMANIAEDKVKEIVRTKSLLKEVKPSVIPTVVSEDLVQKVAHASNVSVNTARQVLTTISTEQLTDTEKVSQVAKTTGLTTNKITEIVSNYKTEAEARVPVTAPTVSVEDYEEVKSMWLKHYRSAPVPVSETIKNRPDWLISEQRKLTNITNLMSSVNPQLKQQGLEKVSEILPFMLLGGFTEAEIMTYIKAKLEADRQVLDELELEEKVKEKTKEELKKEEEETYVEVGKKEEMTKAEELKQESQVPGEGRERKMDRNVEEGKVSGSGGQGKDKVS
ncbi:hypothetical protein A3D78_06425 [Candidatus Gottesmanbacteria bacterium RIFCSPHIGHO2_02_FULL_39_14]|uniref:Uncharacterized protein n=2 Tax=Candidatus Gottesmaniibacteriota TaxID=1752720 RepID=A0A1F5ZWL4_9BACT|nr:MAG: hypothetical protein A3D78_06425 [Candidatus Gottesmanbacteria bacterium RIFCSPHIGHO2_02_FULL_39_14]OGG31378.1 MAG: hypothetical protein A3I51_00660 [Candidatus Gottesmanbacteria bacterium RIFCSPLOWO2_02_FULL_38_8]